MSKRFKVFILIFSIGFLGLLGHAHALISIEKERELGKEVLQMVYEQAELIHDPEVVGFVAKIGNRILEHVGVKYFDYQFFVIKDEALNAFAMPGGFVFVHSGLIEELDSENELACVLAHEIAHVQGRHIARRIDRMQKVNIATTAMAIAGLFLGGGKMSSAVIASAGALNLSIALKYSREDEEEADRRAYQWLCRAGYDPRGLATVLKKMQKFRWLGADSIPSYLSTHPGASERSAYLLDLWERNPCTLKIKFDPLELRSVQIKVRVLSHDPNILIKRFERELEATPNDPYLSFGLGSAYLRARDYSRAEKIFWDLLKTHPEKSVFKRALGRTYFEAGKYEQAQKILDAYLHRNPDDINAIYVLAQTYLELKKYKKGLELLKKIRSKWPDKAAMSLHMGRAYAALGINGKAHYHYYKYYQMTGNSRAAAYHKKKALQLLPSDSAAARELKNGKDGQEAGNRQDGVNRGRP